MTSIIQWVKNKLWDPEKNAIKQIKKGYAMSMAPYFLKISPKVKNWSTIDVTCGPIIRQSFGLTDREIVQKESLNMIQSFMNQELFDFDHEFSQNVLAISIPMAKFECGNHFQTFKLKDEYWEIQPGQFKYKKLSDNIIVTYYYQHGKEYLAGFTYLPVPNGKPLLVENDYALLYIAYYSATFYPPTYPHPMSTLIRKICPKSEFKEVWVGKVRYLGIRHIEFNHWTKQWQYEFCSFCVLDWNTRVYGRTFDSSMNRSESTQTKKPMPVHQLKSVIKSTSVSSLDENLSPPQNLGGTTRWVEETEFNAYSEDADDKCSIKNVKPTSTPKTNLKKFPRTLNLFNPAVLNSQATLPSIPKLDLHIERCQSTPEILSPRQTPLWDTFAEIARIRRYNDDDVSSEVSNEVDFDSKFPFYSQNSTARLDSITCLATQEALDDSLAVIDCAEFDESFSLQQNSASQMCSETEGSPLAPEAANVGI